VRNIGLAAGLILGIALAQVVVLPARAQGPDVRIAQLECSGDPELVVIENQGDAGQALAGWRLESDPPDSEVYDLTVLGALQPGASVFINSGPSASGVFKWGQEFMFRDDDPTDYARIVDDTGAVVDQVNCPGEVAPEESPTSSPTSSPTPSPTPAPSNGVPNGGGPPPPTDGALSSAMMALVGAAVAAVGMASMALSSFGRRPSPVGAVATLAKRGAAARSRSQRTEASGFRGQSLSAAVGLALAGAVAAMVLLIVRQREP
jgi:hypothetical protein